MIRDDEYLETQVMTASPEKLHLMVVNAAIRHAVQADAALQSGEFEQAHSSLNSSRDCVNAMLAGLKDEQSPEVVDRLKGLFLFVHRQLVEADLRHEPARVRDALRVLEMHRETWVAVIQDLQAQGTASDSTAGGESAVRHTHADWTT